MIEKCTSRFTQALRDIAIANPHDSGKTLLIVRKTLEPHNRRLKVEGKQVRAKGLVKYVRHLVDESTGKRQVVTLRDTVALIALGRVYSKRVVLTMMELTVKDDGFVKWQLADTICELADKYRVDLTLHPRIFSKLGGEVKLMMDGEQRLTTYHDFVKDSRGYLTRLHKRRVKWTLE